MDVKEQIILPQIDNSPLVTQNPGVTSPNPDDSDKKGNTSQKDSIKNDESAENSEKSIDTDNQLLAENNTYTNCTAATNHEQAVDIDTPSLETVKDDENHGHKVKFKFRISLAYSSVDETSEEGSRSGTSRPKQRKKRVLEAPKAQNHFHFEYLLVPEGEDRVR